MTVTTTAGSGRRQLTFDRDFPNAPERIWCLISDPAQLSAWWPMRAESLPLELGAPVRFADADGNESIGEITALEHGKTLAFTDDGGAHEVRFEVTASGPGCHLRFQHTFPESDDPAQHEAGWRKCFETFDRVLTAQAAGAS